MNDRPQLTHSPLDSDRFSIRVERALFTDNVPTKTAVDTITNSLADLIIARFSAGSCAIPNALLRSGEALIHADTLVYYEVILPATSGKQAANVRRAQAADLGEIRTIAATAFQNYRSHYAANPLLPAEKILNGYIEWAQSRADPTNASNATWLVIDGDTTAGFATCDIGGDVVEIVLNAVHPEFEKRGHYGTLLRHLIDHYAQTGHSRLRISTQIWNYTVQRQWVRAGLMLTHAHDTFHIDRRLKTQGTK